MSQALVGMELNDLQEALGPTLPRFRSKQLYEALYQRHADTLEQVTAFPMELRRELALRFSVGLPEVSERYESVDGTRRYLLRLEDARTVETVGG